MRVTAACAVTRPMVFLPGIGGRGAFWRPVADLLRPQTAVFVDWPGLGGNPSDPRIRGFDDLAALTLDAVNEPSVLVAQSMGGVVALGVALRASHLVARLVLTATSGGIDVAGLGATDWRPTTADDTPSWALERPNDMSALLPSIEVPALLMWATRDPISPLAVGNRLASLLPQSHLETVDTSDHMFAMNEPAPVADAIRRFLHGNV